ncbi:XRE family transcriptional regulator [Desulfocurvibacter africanus]|uniref:XRE family transcriptional regulator n=1 Tax=Desulfocurvibacter africanus TaxID=873 RepID=UPI002FD8D791
MMKRNSVQIRSWMVRNGIKPSRLARDLNVHHTLVSQTVSGTKNNRRVLRRLRDMGCPKKWLALPKDLESEKQQAA